MDLIIQVKSRSVQTINTFSKLQQTMMNLNNLTNKKKKSKMQKIHLKTISFTINFKTMKKSQKKIKTWT